MSIVSEIKYITKRRWNRTSFGNSWWLGLNQILSRTFRRCLFKADSLTWLHGWGFKSQSILSFFLIISDCRSSITKWSIDCSWCWENMARAIWRQVAYSSFLFWRCTYYSSNTLSYFDGYRFLLSPRIHLSRRYQQWIVQLTQSRFSFDALRSLDRQVPSFKIWCSDCIWNRASFAHNNKQWKSDSKLFTSKRTFSQSEKCNFGNEFKFKKKKFVNNLRFIWIKLFISWKSSFCLHCTRSFLKRSFHWQELQCLCGRHWAKDERGIE